MACPFFEVSHGHVTVFSIIIINFFSTIIKLFVSSWIRIRQRRISSVSLGTAGLQVSLIHRTVDASVGDTELRQFSGNNSWVKAIKVTQVLKMQYKSLNVLNVLLLSLLITLMTLQVCIIYFATCTYFISSSSSVVVDPGFLFPLKILMTQRASFPLS